MMDRITLRDKSDKLLSRAGRVEAWARLQIMGGALRFGDKLPSPESLAGRFDVNVNTAREALSRLERDGLIEIRHGKGGFVTRDDLSSQGGDVRAFLARVLAAAEMLGLSPSEVAQLVAAFAAEPLGVRVWLADADHPYLRAFARRLGEEFGTVVDVIDLGDPDSRLPGMPRSGDIVLTPIRTLPVTRERFGGTDATILPLRIRLGGRGLVEIATLPSDTRLGVLCVHPRFAEIMGRAVIRQGISFKQEYAAIDDEAALARVMKNSDAFVISTVARDRLDDDSPVAKLAPMAPLYFELDPESIGGVKDVVARTRLQVERSP